MFEIALLAKIQMELFRLKIYLTSELLKLNKSKEFGLKFKLNFELILQPDFFWTSIKPDQLFLNLNWLRTLFKTNLIKFSRQIPHLKFPMEIFGNFFGNFLDKFEFYNFKCDFIISSFHNPNRSKWIKHEIER